MIHVYVGSLTLVIHIHDLLHEFKVSLNDLKYLTTIVCLIDLHGIVALA